MNENTTDSFFIPSDLNMSSDALRRLVKDDSIIYDIAKVCQSLLSNYLSSAGYDTAVIFSARQDSRHSTVVYILSRMVRYNIYISAEVWDDSIREDYRDALRWAEDVANGKRTIEGLEKKETQAKGVVFLGSNAKYDSNF